MEPYDESQVAARLPDFTIVRMMPGFRIYKGKRNVLVASTAFWTEAVAYVLVEREADRAIRRN